MFDIERSSEENHPQIEISCSDDRLLSKYYLLEAIFSHTHTHKQVKDLMAMLDDKKVPSSAAEHHHYDCHRRHHHSNN